MDEETKKNIIEAAQGVLGHGFGEVSESVLIQIHQAYLSWDESQWVSIQSVEREIELAKKATKKYKSSLRDCGLIGDTLINRFVEPARELIEVFGDLQQANKIYFKERNEEYLLKQRKGPKKNHRLNYYISQMAGWYKEFVGDKPGYGTNSIFPKLIHECLNRIDNDQDSSDHYKSIKNVLSRLTPGPSAASG